MYEAGEGDDDEQGLPGLGPPLRLPSTPPPSAATPKQQQQPLQVAPPGLDISSLDITSAYSKEQGFKEVQPEELALLLLLNERQGGNSSSSGWSSSGSVGSSATSVSGGDGEACSSAAAVVAPLVLDVRTPAEFAQGSVPGARNVPAEALSAQVRQGALDDFRSGPIYVICASGSRSAPMCVRLRKVFHFEDVSNVKGGIAAWRAAGLPMTLNW